LSGAAPFVRPLHATRKNRITRAFSSEVGTGSREEDASKQKDGAPFRFNRNGTGSSHKTIVAITAPSPASCNCPEPSNDPHYHSL
jgi:hypothetical protein